MPARLAVLSGSFAGQTIEIPRGKLLIGREVDCRLRPENALVSHHHCVLLLDEYTLRIRDLGSKNGTFVNGRRIGSGETILLDGDTVTVGDMGCRVEIREETADAQVPIPEAQPETFPQVSDDTHIFDRDTAQAEGSSEAPPAPPAPNVTV